MVARRQERFGSLVLADRPWPDAPPEALARAALDGVRALGLPWSAGARRFRARVELLRHEGADVPDFTDDRAAWLTAEDWLLPYLQGKRSEADIRALDLTEALKGGARLGRLATRQPPRPGDVRDAAGAQRAD